MISPSIGRVVWFWQTPEQYHNGMQPEAAMIARVWSESMINIGGFDHNGTSFARTSVTLVQDDKIPGSGAFCTWMPYQVGQAAKAEELAKHLKDPSK